MVLLWQSGQKIQRTIFQKMKIESDNPRENQDRFMEEHLVRIERCSTCLFFDFDPLGNEMIFSVLFETGGANLKREFIEIDYGANDYVGDRDSFYELMSHGDASMDCRFEVLDRAVYGLSLPSIDIIIVGLTETILSSAEIGKTNEKFQSYVEKNRVAMGPNWVRVVQNFSSRLL